MSVIASVLQFAPGIGVADNAKKAVDLIDRAAKAGSRLAILPENSMYTNADKSPNAEHYSESLDGYFVSELQSAAKHRGINVLAGISETIEDDKRHYNTLVYLDDNGQLQGCYRKIHMYDAFGHRESDSVAPSVSCQQLSFTVDDIKFAAMTCYDIRYPEMTPLLVDESVHAVAIPAAWAAGPMKEYHWNTLVNARAIESTAYVLAAGQSGQQCVGLSAIVDPMGVKISSATEKSAGIATAEISQERVTDVRQTNPCISNRRINVTV